MEAANPQPLGIIIRQSFIDKLVMSINEQGAQREFSFCSKELLGNQDASRSSESGSLPTLIDLSTAEVFVRSRIEFQIEHATWKSLAGEEIELELSVQHLFIDAELLAGCPSSSRPVESLTHIMRLRIEVQEDSSFLARYFIHPKDLSVRMDDSELVGESLKRALQIKWTDQTGDRVFTGSSAFLNLDQSKELALELAQESIPPFISSKIREQLRGLVFTQSLSEILKDHPLWRESPLGVEEDLFSLRNRGARRRTDVAFSFYPRRSQSVFIGRDQLELYLNAVFVTDQELRQIALAEGHEQSDTRRLVEVLESQLLAGEGLPDAEFFRPSLPRREADLSLLISGDLINQALVATHLSELQEFEAEGHLGVLLEGVVFENLRNLRLHMGLGSRTAPQLRFEPNRLELLVSDYFLSAGIRIKDRVIPTAELQAQVRVNARPVLGWMPGAEGAGTSLNLAIDPDSFEIQLSNQGQFQRRFTEPDLELFEDLARRIWTTFFRQNPQLFVMLSVFDQAPVELIGIEVKENLLLMHFNYSEFNRVGSQR
ncbi:MAG: hypothetical protein EA369_08410 [Bradymonadales bacterium]|nr:MAG: hypothetical protein EA369_08410 [Bradymonadales bacterium]